MKIRDADQHDFSGCVACFPREWRGQNFEALEARLGHQLFKDYVFVAVDDGVVQHPPSQQQPGVPPPGETIMGFSVCDADFFDSDGFYLRTTVVGQQYQKKGVGEALVRHAITWAFVRNVRRVFCDVIDPALAKILQDSGFEKVGECKHMHAEDLDYQI